MSIKGEPLDFIHIGKTGGTSLLQLLEKKIHIENIYNLNKYDRKEKVTHISRPDKYMKNKWITIIRDPLERFISAFNTFKFATNANRSTMVYYSNLKHPIIEKKNTPWYDIKEIKSFDNVNQLLEALSDNPDSKKYKDAHFLMNHEHLGSGYHKFLRTNPREQWIYNNIDLCLHVAVLEDPLWQQKLCKKLDITMPNKEIHIKKGIREFNRYVSLIAKRNFFNFHKDKDYRIIGELAGYDVISKDTFKNYLRNVINDTKN